MRVMAKIGIGISVGGLTLALAACGSGGSQASTNSTAKPAASAASTTPTASGAAAIPSTPVCGVISKTAISTQIGMSVYSADDNDVIAGAQPTICDYYTNTDQTSYVEIHWMTVAQALWSTQMANLGTSSSGGLTTTTSKDTVLGDDAIKGTAKSDMISTTDYQVLLKSGFVVEIANCSEPSLSDTAFYNAVEWVVRTLDKL